MITLFLSAAEPVATGKFLIDWSQLFNVVLTLGMAIIGYLTLRIHTNSKKGLETIVKVDEKTDEQAVTLKEVKVDVNSGRTKLEDKLNRVEEKLLVTTGEKAASDAKVVAEQDKATTLAATKETKE